MSETCLAVLRPSFVMMMSSSRSSALDPPAPMARVFAGGAGSAVSIALRHAFAMAGRVLEFDLKGRGEVERKMPLEFQRRWVFFVAYAAVKLSCDCCCECAAFCKAVPAVASCEAVT